jgi:hypothetical protein
VLADVDAAGALYVSVKKVGPGIVTIENVTVHGSLRSLSAQSADISGGAVTVNGYIGSMALNGITNATVKINGPALGSNAFVLESLAVSEAVSGSQISFNGNAGRITAGQVLNSTIFAGYTPAVSTNMMAGGAFVNGFQIESVTVPGIKKSATNAFVNSVIAADKIGSVALASVATNNGGTAFGVAGNTSVRFVAVGQPKFSWNPDGHIVQKLGDFVARRLSSFSLAQGATVVDQADLVNNASTNHTFLFANSGALQGVQPGNILVGSTGYGFLVKVLSVSNQASLLSIQTTNATLADVIQEGAFDEPIQFKPSTITYLAPGVNIVTNQMSLEREAKAAAAGLHTLADASLSAQLVLDYDFGDVELAPGVTLSGSADLTVTPQLSAQFGLLTGLQSFSATVNAELMDEASVSIAESASETEDTLLASVDGEPVLFLVGVVPVVVVPVLDLHGGVTASVAGSMSVGATATAGLTMGAQWQSGAGWIPIYSQTLGFVPEYSPPTVTASVYAYLRPVVTLKLYDVAGPDIYAEAGPQLSATADPSQVCWSLNGQLSAGVGIDLTAFGAKDNSYQKELASYSIPLASECEPLNGGPPAVTTLAASAITSNSAVLNGTVNPKGLDTISYFQWGDSTDYGNTTDIVDIGDGTNTVSAMAAITGLDPTVTYHFRLVAMNIDGTTMGLDQTFSPQVTASPAFTIEFDDLTTPTLDTGDGFYFGEIPNGYNGFTWNNLNPIDGLTSTGSGYQTGVISPNNDCFNSYGDPGSMTSTQPFNFYSAYLTAAWTDGLELEVEGYAGDKLVYDNSYSLSTAGPVFVNFNYLGVTEVHFSTAGGLGYQFVMDNVSVSTNAPINPQKSRLVIGRARSLTHHARTGSVAQQHAFAAGGSGPSGAGPNSNSTRK